MSNGNVDVRRSDCPLYVLKRRKMLIMIMIGDTINHYQSPYWFNYGEDIIVMVTTIIIVLFRYHLIISSTSIDQIVFFSITLILKWAFSIRFWHLIMQGSVKVELVVYFFSLTARNLFIKAYWNYCKEKISLIQRVQNDSSFIRPIKQPYTCTSSTYFRFCKLSKALLKSK